MEHVRVLGACSIGGAGHLNPMLPMLDAAQRRGDEVLVVGPPSMQRQVAEAGYAFVAGGEPAESDVAPIRDRLPTAPADEASVLGNRELFGRLATHAMLPVMVQVIPDWCPDLVIREPCEYASAVVAAGLAQPCPAAGLVGRVVGAVDLPDVRLRLRLPVRRRTGVSRGRPCHRRPSGADTPDPRPPA